LKDTTDEGAEVSALEEYEETVSEQEMLPVGDERLLHASAIADLADAAIESLKCCGNCGLYYDRTGICSEKPCPAMNSRDACIWSPSRWQERT
jgi:hypothetical protein